MMCVFQSFSAPMNHIAIEGSEHRPLQNWLTCAMSGPVVRRAVASALVVGPLLTAINHGDAIISGDISGGRLLKIALTVIVPFAVSTCSSVHAAQAHYDSATTSFTHES